MPTSNKRLVGPLLVTNAPATVYTCPASTVAQVQFVNVNNPGPTTGASITFTLTIGADAQSTRVYAQYLVAAGSSFERWVKYPMAAGEVLQIYASSNNVLVATISGTENVPG